tara:strand:- start:263 stop:400 length:138 start_codon:yes stop_codon:yes gene_type:complete
MKIEYWLDVKEVNKIEWVKKWDQFSRKIKNLQTGKWYFYLKRFNI